MPTAKPDAADCEIIDVNGEPPGVLRDSSEGFFEMIDKPWLIVLVTAAVLFLIAKCVGFVRDDQRMIVERAGRFHTIHGPGWHVSNAFIDKCIIVNLEQTLPGWRGYTEEQLKKKLVQDFYSHPSEGKKDAL